jgi:hypothetical protein
VRSELFTGWPGQRIIGRPRQHKPALDEPVVTGESGQSRSNLRVSRGRP